MEILDVAKGVIKKEAAGLSSVASQLGEPFMAILGMITACDGKVCVIGMGKSGHVARKMAATMASLGTCAVCLHPAECLHGDLGMIQRRDVVLLISNSGESEEIVRILPGIKAIGARTAGITCNADSKLARSCDVVQVLDDIEEACLLGLAPTTSTTAVMAYGDALAVAASALKGFTRDDFGMFHPAGSLGKRLTVHAVDLMRPLRPQAIVEPTATVAEAVIAISESGADVLVSCDSDGRLAGILTNGDLRRAIESGCNIRERTVEDMVNRFPCFVDVSAMAVDALRAAEERGVGTLPVVREDVPVGLILKSDILKEGIYL